MTSNTIIHHLLIIDDDTRIRELLARYLKDNGFIVSSAKDAFEAEEKIKEYTFDLLILDVMMPHKTGIEFMQELRKTSDIPIIMLTAMGGIEDRITGLENGADDYLPKPFEPRELLLRIQNILGRKGENLVYFGNMQYIQAKSELQNGLEVICLTATENSILSALSENLNNLTLREDLAKKCGGINDRSVDVQIIRIRNKIEPDPKNPRYLKNIRGKGYILFGNKR